MDAGQKMMTPELWGVLPPLAELPAPLHVTWSTLSFKCSNLLDIQICLIVLFSNVLFRSVIFEA